MQLWLYDEVIRRAKGGPIPGWLVYSIGVFAVINFVVYVVIAEYIGGDAVNGHESAGHFFLSNHGRLTEVSRDVFRYSQWHTAGVFITHAIAIMVGLISFRKRSA